jgi:hypothetical protein
MNRRRFLAGASTLTGGLLAGCGGVAGDQKRPAHWVTVYLGDREETHDVTVTVTDEGGDALFEKEYRLSDDNEADEDAPFPESSEPARVAVTVDGARFEYDWPGFEHPQLPCEDPNWAGIELWIETGGDGSPDVRLAADCQHVTMD